MAQGFVLSDYIELALAEAVYEKLDDGSFTGRIPYCSGVVAVAASLAASERELRSKLEDRIVLGLKRGHALPVLGGIDLNRQPEHVALGSVARLSGTTKADAVTQALPEKLARLKRGRPHRTLADELEDIARRFDELPVRDTRPTDEIFRCDDLGIPR